jgi:ABC-type multidrug transport system permease subunit
MLTYALSISEEMFLGQSDYHVSHSLVGVQQLMCLYLFEYGVIS